MPVSTCSNLYFPSGNTQFVTFSDNIQQITTKGGGAFSFKSILTRPYIPYIGLKLDGATQTWQYLPVAEQIANAITFVDYFNDASLASTNYSLNNAGQPQEINDPDDSNLFDSYLYKKLYQNPEATNRYNSIRDYIYQFWLNANAAWTAEQYFNAIQTLKQNLKIMFDPNYFISPVFLDYTAAAPTCIDIAAWKAADANALEAFGCVEASLV